MSLYNLIPKGVDQMGLETLYKEVMQLNMMADNSEKEAAAKVFFAKLNADSRVFQLRGGHI
jgi:hypothetical protein